jgi:molybdopterin-guanine dinucleotide biosynthesis protein A
MRMLDVEGFILVGGASSRMGVDKSRLVLEGRASAERIAAALRPIAEKISVVGSHAPGADQLPNVPDLHQRWGPLGGIHAALSAARAEWCVVVACDLPFVTSELLGRLMMYIDDVDAVVPMQADKYAQPLCAIYRRRPCLIAAEEAIARDEHSPRALLDKVTTRYVEFDELASLAGSDYFFFNVNTPENYERAKEILASRDRTEGDSNRIKEAHR